MDYSEEQAQQLLMDLDSWRGDDLKIAVDTETTGLRVANGDDFCIGTSIAGVIGEKPFKAYFPFAHETGKNFGKETHEMLNYVLTQDATLLIFANVQFDILSLQTIHIDVEDQNFIDICTMAHLVNENWPKNKGVESLAQYYLGESGKIVDEFVEAEKKSGNHNITPEEMREYAIKDAVSTYRIWNELVDNPVWQELPERLWTDKQDLIRVLLAMKRRGVAIDVPLARQEIAVGEAEMKRIATELGYPPKPTKREPDPLPTLGPIALTEIFIERLGLPILKKGARFPSFAKDIMEQYDEMLERIDSTEAKLVKQYRGWQKTVSAAYRPYVELLDSDGRLRCSYKTHGTVTGRLSCSEPNLQQIPKESDKVWNGKVKHCFIPKEGYTLVNADFSQLELRLGTAYADETELKQVFLEGRDIFTEMSKELGFDRQTTKTFVYSTQYGAGVTRIMSAFGVTKSQAEMMIRKYKNTYPRFAMLADRCAAAVERAGKIKLWTGRYRHFEYASESFKAMNSVIQGGAADIMERIMVQVFQEIDNEDCQMLLQVHDSITFEVRSDLVSHYIPAIKACMEDVSRASGHDQFDVKFAVDVDLWIHDDEPQVEEAVA